MKLQADAYTIEKHRRRAQRLLEELARCEAGDARVSLRDVDPNVAGSEKSSY